MSQKVTAFDLQDYVEGHLSQERHPYLDQHLTQNPALATRARRLQRQVTHLRAFGERILREPVPPRFCQLLWNLSE